MEPILIVNNLTKEYDGVVALNNVTLEINKGTIFGLLGPNGAGKTTLIRILTGITIPDKGSYSLQNIENRDFESLSKMIGYLPEERGLYSDMNVIDQLEFFGQIKGLKSKEAREKIDYYSERMGIRDWYLKKAKDLSKGMQQMVQFTATIFYEPSLIILDEPFTGLDPLNSNKIINEIHELQKKGTTIIFSTHRLEQVEEICENIALINKGQILLEGNIFDIKQMFKKHIYRVETKQQVSKETLTNSRDYEVIDANGKLLHIKRTNPKVTTNSIIKSLITDIEIVSFVEILPSLNDIFIEQVKNCTIENTTSDGQSKINANIENSSITDHTQNSTEKKKKNKRFRFILSFCTYIICYIIYRVVFKR